MDVYVFQAALICADCAIGHKQDNPCNVNEADESSYDSGEWPKGPYPDGGGEADSPQHCDHCWEFLNNPLTEEGENRVREAFRVFVEEGQGVLLVLQEWRDAYQWVWDAYTDQAFGIPRLTPEARERFDRLAA